MNEEQELSTIKRPNDPVEVISDEEYRRRIKELARCKRDIIYFAEHYYRLVNLDLGLHVVKLYDVLKELLKFIVDNDKTVVCSGRQQGKSTIYCIYVLWLICFFPDKRVMILAQKESTALEILSRIATGYEYLPYWIKPACTVFNKKSIELANRSVVKAFASSSDGARGMSANILILDEFAFVPKNIADKLFSSVYPVISSSKNGKVIIVSTPNGTDNLYYDIWSKANARNQTNNLDGWKPFTMYWWQVPGRDEEWKQKQIAAIGKDRFAQEFNNEFINASNFQKLVPDDILEKYKMLLNEWKTAKINQGIPLEILSADENKRYTFTMYHAFDENRTYIASGDVAEGTGGDFSIILIWDITNTSEITLCCEFASSHVSTIEFAYIINKICKLYCNPYLIIEANGIGAGVLELLRLTYEYDNLVRLGKDNAFGVKSHMQVKSRACIWLREMLTTEGFGFNIYSKRLVDEMGTFVKKDSSLHIIYLALGKNSHDDFMMTFVWMAWLLNEENIENYFTVVETFTSTLLKILPKTILPAFEYTLQEIIEAKTSRQYLLFLECVDAMHGHYGRVRPENIKPVVKTEEKEINDPSVLQVINPNMSLYADQNTLDARKENFAYAGFSGFGFNDGWN